jgi:hypothetical protein
MYDIFQVNPRQLAPTVGTLGVGIMNSTAFSFPASSNSKVDRNQISFGIVDFQPYPPTLTLVFASLNQEMDLTIGSLNFRVGSLGSIHLSDPMKSELSVGSSSEVKIAGQPPGDEKHERQNRRTRRNHGKPRLRRSNGSLRFQPKFQQRTAADFTTQNGGVSSNVHQVCVIITEAAEDNDVIDNTIVNTQGNNPRSNSKKEKEKIYISAEEWRIIMSAINHGRGVPADSRREVLMGYQYTLHQHKKKIREEKNELRRSQENNSATSTGTNTAKCRIPAKKDIANQNTSGEGQHSPRKRIVQGASSHHYQMKRKTSYKKRQKQL